jgi:prepilin-type processing-associated H-X9-DG protein
VALHRRQGLRIREVGPRGEVHAHPCGAQSGGRSGSIDLSAAIPTTTDADTGNNAWMRYRHSGKVNVVMFDGHAEAIEKGKVLNKHVVYGQ